MNPFEIKTVLESMTVLVDTREQDTERARARYEQIGRPIRRRTLKYGDYTYNATLPDGSPLYPSDGTIEPKFCVIERKMDLEELAQCLTRSRRRFREEFKKAAENGCRIYLLVENGSWGDILHGVYQTKVHPNAYVSSLTAWMIRYNAQVIFCPAKDSGRMIEEILRRDLKERLESGEI